MANDIERLTSAGHNLHKRTTLWDWVTDLPQQQRTKPAALPFSHPCPFRAMLLHFNFPNSDHWKGHLCCGPINFTQLRYGCWHWKAKEEIVTSGFIWHTNKKNMFNETGYNQGRKLKESPLHDIPFSWGISFAVVKIHWLYFYFPNCRYLIVVLF